MLLSCDWNAGQSVYGLMWLLSCSSGEINQNSAIHVTGCNAGLKVGALAVRRDLSDWVIGWESSHAAVNPFIWLADSLVAAWSAYDSGIKARRTCRCSSVRDRLSNMKFSHAIRSLCSFCEEIVKSISGPLPLVMWRSRVTTISVLHVSCIDRVTVRIFRAARSLETVLFRTLFPWIKIRDTQTYCLLNESDRWG